MTYIRKQNPSDLIEYLTCSGVDSVSFQSGKYIKKIDLSSESPSKILYLVTDVLNHFRMGRRSCPEVVPANLLIVAYDGMNIQMYGEWEEKTYNFNDNKGTTNSVNLLIFSGMTIFPMFKKR